MTKQTRVAPATFFMLLVILQLGISCYIIVAGPAHITAVLDNDDAYYYLQTAWNANKNDFVSFDGINKTNGFHFLWFWVLYVLSFATDDKAVFLQLSRLVDALLTCVPYVVIWQLSSRLRNTRHPLFGPVMAVSWFVIVLTDRHRFLVGLESPLHATIIWLLISQCLKLCPPHGGEGLSVRDTSVFFVLLVLNTWARLDSFVVSGCFLVLFLHTYYYRRNRLQLTGDRPLAAVFRIGVAILVGGAALQFGFFWSVGDSLIPVSGLIKRYHASYLSLGAMYDWSQILFPIRVRLFNIFGILAFCLATAGLVWSSGCAANGYERAFRRASASLGISVLLYSFVIFGTFQNYYYWYLSPTFVFWVIVMGVGADVTLRVVQPRPFIQWSVLVLLALVLFWHVGVSPRTIESPLFKARYATATWIDRNLEQDAIIGAFNAGQIGYFSNRRVVNLDGLVNHVTYFRLVIQAPTTGPMIDYLADMNIRYIVDYRFGRWASEIAERYDVIREFPIEGQDASVQVLRKSRPEPR